MASQGMTALANFTVATAQATVTFSNIPATYRDLRLVISCKSTTGGVAMLIPVNGDTTSTYLSVSMYGTGSTTGSRSLTQAGLWLELTSSTSELNLITVDFLDYSVTDKHKTILARSGIAGSQVTSATAARWPQTSAITSFTIPASGDTWQAGSTFTLYGVSA